ncbi:uncharacterized protein LOC132794947 [Drosophila nasuta]|uniref:uncharacterized protein LOC132794947 n=1 Tax=Drosophila nasuta TaxID=42062 RepID=UPI00295E31EA|nr:uncharacterized protein LOC132794947 [Drosophila nasuta]XP_060661255.1 uncharacterized protein LOC132794947 [Drosophila nasuta]XP_060661256.1 uncharacterized protein LOC132794947 [Drosophila nasuta]XP_060661258.1 uncharacterized protein LOC132794947 [Drosophila nasuta]
MSEENETNSCSKRQLRGFKNHYILAMPPSCRANCERIKYNMKFVLIISFYLICSTQCILVEEHKTASEELLMAISSPNNNTNNSSTFSNNGMNTTNNIGSNVIHSSPGVGSKSYLDKLDNMERSVAAVIIKVAYGTTSTTKRSIPDNSYVLGLTTVATPPLTTLRYQLAHHKPQITSNSRHRNYELDLERDHALPTSAPNADILKSNNNPTYPNPNRHHSSSTNNHDRDRHRHTMQYNSTPMPSFPNLLKKNHPKGQPTIPMYPGDIPSYSPPSRSFFTPPLPPEYQNPFADKPTLRGTNNEGLIAGNTVQYNNRRPIPPPSLTPGHERIPFRPPDLTGESNVNGHPNISYSSHILDVKKKANASSNTEFTGDRKKALNTPSRSTSNEQDIAVEATDINHKINTHIDHKSSQDVSDGNAIKRQEVLPNIRRILGSNGKKSDIPAVLLRQVTQRPIVSYQKPPASAIVAVTANEHTNIDETTKEKNNNDESTNGAGSNINKSKQMDHNDFATHDSFANNISKVGVTTPSAAAAAIDDAVATSFTSATMQQAKPTITAKDVPRKASSSDGSTASTAAATIWTWAWHVHIYLSVVLFTILAVYSLYKLLTYNKLTHLFAQSYFVYIHLILIAICIMRIFYLCFDAYNVHGTFHIFVSELLLNLPATFLTVAFSVLILFLFLKSLNHKNNRYSALVRPLTVVVGCGVHVLLCITLHYVESYTLQNHHMYFQQQQQQQYFRRQQQQQQLQQLQLQQQHQSQSLSSATITSITSGSAITMLSSTSLASPQPPPRVLSLICQIIYIFICLSLGLLYLYLYRILKRILRSKSQNYIHGYQNLSYAIHITIATALLFVLLATLQIFGAVCISSVRTSLGEVDVDWMQWGYQFSLRLIEIAIITLISWVTGLKHNVNGTNSNAPSAVNGDVHMIGHSAVAAVGTGTAIREKHGAVAHQHSNVANFFLPCTSGSSQEQFENDYPTICNANTNLHTYTMRTGKLIYDDSYALHSLGGPGAGVGAGAGAVGVVVSPEYQMQEPTYQRPYDTGSIRSALNHNMKSAQTSQRYHHHQHQQATYITTTGYMTDATTDHYENPNFDLITNSSTMGGRVEIAVPGGGASAGSCGMKLSKNTVSSGSASVTGSGCGSGSGSGSSGTSQQQMLLLQSDSCYSEPLQENSSYEFHNFERPIFKEESHASDECWPERDREREKHKKCKGRKQNNVGNLERTTYDNQERRSSNSTNSCSSSSNNGVVVSSRYASYNSYERKHHDGIRKSGTLNNIVNGSTMGIMIPQGPAQRHGVMQCGKRSINGTQTLNERSHYYQRSTAQQSRNRCNDFELAAPIPSTPTAQNELSLKKHQQQQLQQHYNHHNSDDEADEEEEEDDDDEMMPGCNVESANLITNNDNNSITSNPLTVHLHHHLPNVSNAKSIHHQHQNPLEMPELSVNLGSASVTAMATDNLMVSDQTYRRSRANNDDENVDQLGARTHAIHNVLHQPTHSIPSTSLLQINSNGIDC